MLESCIRKRQPRDNYVTALRSSPRSGVPEVLAYERPATPRLRPPALARDDGHAHRSRGGCHAGEFLLSHDATRRDSPFPILSRFRIRLAHGDWIPADSSSSLTDGWSVRLPYQHAAAAGRNHP
jgi:hypothetical protein